MVTAVVYVVGGVLVFLGNYSEEHFIASPAQLGGVVLVIVAGATLTYVWTAFPARPESGGPLAEDLIGNAVFGAVAVVILFVAVRRMNPNQR